MKGEISLNIFKRTILNNLYGFYHSHLIQYSSHPFCFRLRITDN